MVLYSKAWRKCDAGDPRYAASKWYSINFQWVFGMQLIGGGGGG